MSTYLKFHELERSPFEGQGSDQLVLATASLRRAYAEIKTGLEEGAPRICVSGGAGIGKSSFARALPKLLESTARCVLVRDPGTEWSRIENAVARQLQLQSGQVSRTTLVATRREGRRIVMVIDRAEELPAESLEQLDILLGYQDNDGEQLVQCVLLADLEEAPRGREIPLLWWLDQLTTRQLRFSPIPEEGIRSYVDKRLQKAGFQGASLFTDEAVTAIHRYTGGVPGAVSALCEELLSRAADQRTHEIDRGLVAIVCGDALPLTEAEEAEEEVLELEERSEADRPRTAAPEPHQVQPRLGQRPGTSFDGGDSLDEPELEIQQGYVHMDTPQRPAATSVSGDSNDDDPFAGVVAPSRESRRREPLPRAVSGFSPGSGRSARMVRKLIAFALLACLAMVVHIVFFAGQPTLPRLTKRIPPAVAFLEEHAPKLAIDQVLSGPESDVEPEAELEPAEIAAAEPDSEALIEPEEPGGLTSDLRIDRSETNAAALEASARPVAEKKEASDEASDLSLGELYDLAEQAGSDASEDFEPWAEQAPEAATPPNPAAPASP